MAKTIQASGHQCDRSAPVQPRRGATAGGATPTRGPCKPSRPAGVRAAACTGGPGSRKALLRDEGGRETGGEAGGTQLSAPDLNTEKWLRW